MNAFRVCRAQGDIQGMQDQVKVLASHAARDAKEAADSVVTIRQLDLVKRNMESACSTLKEATELSGMFIKVRLVLIFVSVEGSVQLLASARAWSALSAKGSLSECCVTHSHDVASLAFAAAE